MTRRLNNSLHNTGVLATCCGCGVFYWKLFYWSLQEAFPCSCFSTPALIARFEWCSWVVYMNCDQDTHSNNYFSFGFTMGNGLFTVSVCTCDWDVETNWFPMICMVLFILKRREPQKKKKKKSWTQTQLLAVNGS